MKQKKKTKTHKPRQKTLPAEKAIKVKNSQGIFPQKFGKKARWIM